MAIDYQQISKTNRPNLGAEAIAFANALRDVRDKCDALNDAAAHMHDGSNFATVETMFGLTGGQGSNWVTLLQQTHDILNTNATVAGADRLSRLDEIVARVAGQ